MAIILIGYLLFIPVTQIQITQRGGKKKIKKFVGRK